MKSRVIFVEGISGSGKTSTCQFLYRQYLLTGYDARFFHEFHIPHPIHEWYLTDPQEWIDTTLTHWQVFVKKTLASEKIIIMDSALFQGTMSVLLELDVDRDIILDYAYRVPEIIRPLNPSLVYFYQADYRKALLKIYQQREEKTRIKKDNFIRTIKYGQNRNLYGHEGYMRFVGEFRDISNELFKNYDMSKISIENSAGDWPDYNLKIKRFLSIPLIADTISTADYEGTYRDIRSGQECRIVGQDNGELEIHGFFPVRKFLCPRSDDTLFIRGKAHELIFRRGPHGNIEKMISRWYIKESEETTWLKTG
ncbi:MAG: hypothetical protein GY839_02670 [candidate division Zixibacteria bacterium]|nr:hypothetical protein [candidate division Zixibacteria bacterium]